MFGVVIIFIMSNNMASANTNLRDQDSIPLPLGASTELTRIVLLICIE
jgi:hypothetical protein